MIHHLTTRRPAAWSDTRLFHSPRSDYRAPHYARLYAGSPDHPRRAALLDLMKVTIFSCPSCLQRFYGSHVLVSQSCPACDGRLQIVGTWDLSTAWPWLERGGEG
jgi:hypothetical protein